MRLDDRGDVGGQVRVLVFAPPPASRGEILQTADPPLGLVQSLFDRLSPPTEPPFGQPGAAAAKLFGHLGLEQSALVSGQSSRPRAEQGVESV